MDGNEPDHKPVFCRDCKEKVVFKQTPYSDSTDYVVECDCEPPKQIDVSEVAESSSLVTPPSGKWSNIDFNTRVKSNDYPHKDKDS